MKNHSRNLILITLCLLALQITGCAGKRRLVYIEPTTGMEFILIPGGEFVMGDTTGTGHKRERPVRTLTITPLAVGIYEVTFDQYDKYCAAVNCEQPDDKQWGRGARPVINVSWLDAMAFADWLSAQSGHKFTLPTEAQWEYFSQTNRSPNSWVRKDPEQNLANCDGCGSPWERIGTAPVGTFPPSPQGLYDTAGNVNEWCLDTMHSNYVGAPVDGRAWIDEETKVRIHRGGNWTTPPKDLSTYARDFANEKHKSDYTGFRLVMENLPTAKE